MEKIKLLTLKCVQILIFLLFVSFHWKFKFHLLTNKLLHTITLLLKFAELNGFPWVIIYTNNFHDRLYLHSTTDEKRKRGEKNFHHRNLREEKKKKRKKKERSFLFLPTFKLQLINAPFFPRRKIRKIQRFNKLNA